jgi:hypothetical protein
MLWGNTMMAMTATGSLLGSGMSTDFGGSAIRTMAVVVAVSIARLAGQTKHPN